MHVTLKQLEKSQMELIITVPVAEQEKYLVRAAEKLAAEHKIPGFRPGKAPYDVVAGQLGEMKILETALEPLIRETFVAAVKEHELKTVGMPDVKLEKVAPKNDVIYHAIISLVPEITLPDISKIKISLAPGVVPQEKVDEVLQELQRMHAVAVVTDAAVDAHSQVTLDMDLFDGLVPLEGGQARAHVVHMDEPYYIPGFTEKLMGAHAGDALEFTLPFPADHYQKLYAGKDILFKIKITKVETRTLPALDNEFGKKLGAESLEKMRERILQNLQDEADRKAAEAAEIDMLRQIVAATKFGDMPENLVEAERRKIFQELQQNLQRHGISVEQYLGDLKKSPEELEAGFTDQAIERAKMGLLTHEIAKKENIEVSKEELQEELEAIRASYKGNADAIKRLLQPEIQELVLNSLRNRKVVGFLAEKIIEKK